MKTIKDLKEAIKDLPDDLPVLMEGGLDHSYDIANFDKTSAAKRKVGKYNKVCYSEWAGKEYAGEGEVEVPVFLIY